MKMQENLPIRRTAGTDADSGDRDAPIETALGQLLACLQQTGLVSSVKQWTLPTEKLPDASEGVPDVVFLDLSRDAESFFAFGAHLRRLRPAVRLIACSQQRRRTSRHYSDAMRCGVQDFINKPVTPEALKDVLTRFRAEGLTAERKAAEKTDRRDGIERRSGHDDGGCESWRAALDLRPQSTWCCSISRGRWETFISCSICTRVSSSATRWKISTAWTAISSAAC